MVTSCNEVACQRVCLERHGCSQRNVVDFLTTSEDWLCICDNHGTDQQDAGCNLDHR